MLHERTQQVMKRNALRLALHDWISIAAKRRCLQIMIGINRAFQYLPYISDQAGIIVGKKE